MSTLPRPAGDGGAADGGAGPLVRVVQDPADVEACLAVRRQVFVDEQGVSEDLEYDGLDDRAVQVLAVHHDGTPLGTGRLLHGPVAADRTGGDPRVGALGRLAVLRAARGRGVGAALVRGIEAAAVERGLTAMDLHAQTHALAFYERLGYAAHGPEFLDAGIAHRAMRKELTAAPAR